MNGSEQDVVSWRKSSYSGNGGTCVEVGRTVSGVMFRDSKDRSGGTLEISRSAWMALLHGQRYRP